MKTPLYFKRGIIAMAAAASLSVGARAVEYVPVYNFTLLGGQYFFAGDKTNLNANAYFNAAPALKFNDRWTLLPIYSSAFRGTKSVSDSVGSASLFQQGMDHRISFAGLYSVKDKPWVLKPSVSYKRAFLKETKNEKWGKGLFDFQTYGVGAAAEKTYRSPFTYRFGYDFYYIKFHNYQSLESQSGVDPSGSPLGRERAGTRVLDTYNHEFSLSATRPFPYNRPKMSVSANYRFRWQTFPDQPIIAITGVPNSHAPTHRQDFLQTMDVTVGVPAAFRGGRLRLGSSWQTMFAYNGSNQNTFDANQTKFIFDSYSYMSWTVGPRFNLSWGDEKRPVTAGTSFSYSRTRYFHRLAQLSDGTYTTDKQYQDRWVLSLNYGYPIAEQFRLSAQINSLWARSNNKFESTYRYTYATVNYLMGFTYSY